MLLGQQKAFFFYCGFAPSTYILKPAQLLAANFTVNAELKHQATVIHWMLINETSDRKYRWIGSGKIKWNSFNRNSQELGIKIKFSFWTLQTAAVFRRLFCLCSGQDDNDMRFMFYSETPSDKWKQLLMHKHWRSDVKALNEINTDFAISDCVNAMKAGARRMLRELPIMSCVTQFTA